MFSDVRQIETHTAEPSHFQFEIAVAELKKYKSSDTDQIPANC
jgi:hypothetical protein